MASLKIELKIKQIWRYMRMNQSTSNMDHIQEPQKQFKTLQIAQNKNLSRCSKRQQAVLSTLQLINPYLKNLVRHSLQIVIFPAWCENNNSVTITIKTIMRQGMIGPLLPSINLLSMQILFKCLSKFAHILSKILVLW